MRGKSCTKMHTVTEMETNVPAFLGKLWKLVEDPETDDLICWAPNGRSFFIRNQAQFARELLPHYYKHNNMASFVRQLNMYGFHKKVSVELGGLKCDRDEMEFAHQYFVKGHPYLLEHIKRKIASNKSQDSSNQPMKPEVMNKVLSEVRTMRGRQEHLDSRLGAMKRENEALWRELAMLRRKHLKQQEIVNKLIHFLVTLVQPTRSGGLPVKRRYPLMIDNTNHPRTKQSKLTKPEASPTGPVIHELDASEHDLDNEYIVTDVYENHPTPSMQSPESQALEAMEDETAEMIENAIRVPENIQLMNSRQFAAKKKPKGKKKRKNKVPIKILIPATESGEEAREETLMLDVSPDEESQQQQLPKILTESKVPSTMKPVPVRTVRSSKLAAMAANINKMNDVEDEEVELELDSSEDADEIEQKVDEDGVMRLEDILIIPQVMNDNSTTDEIEDDPEIDDEDATNCSSNGIVKSPASVEFVMNDQPRTVSEIATANNLKGGATTMATTAAGSSSKSKDLSLSCVNSSARSDASYREDMDNHLETMQTELDNLREVLRGEGYSIDANTLLGLFGADDPMSFGIPVNPELDPHPQRDRDEEERATDNTNYTAAGGELMAYNPAASLLDFDDDIFLDAGEETANSGATGNNDGNGYYNTDPLDLEDSKASLLASLVAANESNPSTS